MHYVKRNIIERDIFLNEKSKDTTAMLAFAEVYNGLGYYNMGVVNPYIYSGTNIYKSGKFGSDGKYSSTLIDKQPGVYVLINKIINVK